MRSIALYILSAFSLVAFQQVSAQQATTVKATVDKNRILIGEQITLSLEAIIPINEAVRFFVIDSLDHFEVLDKAKTDTNSNLRQTILKQSIILTSFDSGKWVIPSLVLTEGIQTDSMVVDVVFSEFDPNQPYHSIKDVIAVEVKKEEKTDMWWYIAAAGAALIIGLIYLLTRKKKQPQVTVEHKLTPYEQAVQSLEQLNKHGVDDKTFFTGLSDTLRLYIYQRKGLEWRHLITDDLIRELGSVSISADLSKRLSQGLLLGDFVKFAKYDATNEEKSFSYDAVRATIDEIEKKEKVMENERREEQQ